MSLESFVILSILLYLECKPIPGITIKRERTCIWRSCVKKALLMKTEWRKDKVQRGNPLFKCQAVGAILSPALISSFLLPSWLRFLTFVSPSWPFACLCRWVWLNTCQVATDIHHPWFGEVVHACVTPQEGKDARWRKSKVWRKCEFNPSDICFHTWFGLCDFPSTTLSVQVPASLFLGLQVSLRFLHRYSISTFSLILLHKTSLLLELALWN